VPRTAIDGTKWEVEFESLEGQGRRRGAADPHRVLEAWRSAEPLVPLLEGGWAPLPVDWLERFGQRVADLLEARAADGTLPRAAIPDLVRLHDDLDEPAPPELRSLEAALRDFTGLPSADIPSDVTAELRGYQRAGIDWLVFLRRAGLGALLADDMGLGKTLQALCAVHGRTLVVAPTSVLHNWLEEAERFRPVLRCCRFHGPRRNLDPNADLTLTTYAILRLDVDLLAAERWDTVVLDEAQAIKNPQSQVAEAAFRLNADCRITLTGTPVENRLDELWSQFHFLNRGLLGGRRSFQERYAAPIAAGTPGAAQRLRERIRPFVLRRMKREVAPELPPRTESVLHCVLTPEEREVYDTIRAASIREVVRKLKAGAGVMDALEVLLRLRQAASHPGLIPGRSAESSSKVALLLDTLDSVLAEGHRALVFSQWTSMLDLLEPQLKAGSIPFSRLDGSTRDRAGVVREFQSDSGPPVLLVSLKAGGTGLNLTAADHVFLLDLWWNPAVEDQAADRAHRIGQHRPVMVYRLVAEETVEERILELQRAKRELADAALGDAEQAASLSRDDLLQLLE
jgi:SNF2 family DNA or RNA helicase